MCDFKVNKPSLKKKKKNPEISCTGECNLVFPSIYSILSDKQAGGGRGGSYAGPGVTKNQIHLLAPTSLAWNAFGKLPSGTHKK